MTDADTGGEPAVVLTCDYAAIERWHRDRQRLAEEIRPANKAVVLAALAAASLTSVVVTFDGAGDSGQIESVDAYAGETAAELPEVDIVIRLPLQDGSGVEVCELSLRDAIEQLAYDLLEDTHDGWEINEGAYGEFTFDVAGDAIRLDYNEWVESSEYSSNEW